MREAELHLAEGERLESQGRIAEAAARFRSGISTLANRDDPVAVDLDVALARAEITGGELSQAQGRLQEAIGRARASGRHPAIAEALTQTARLHRFSGRQPEALICLHDALETYRGVGSRRWLLGTLDQVAGILSESGRSREAVQVGEEILGLRRERPDDPEIFPVLRTLSAAYADLGRFAAAWAATEEGWFHGADLGEAPGTTGDTLARARLLRRLGQPEAALAMLDPSRSGGPAPGDAERARRLLESAECHLDLSRADGALRSAASARAGDPGPSRDSLEPKLRAVEAEAERLRGDGRAAASRARETLALAETRGEMAAKPRMLLLLSRLSAGAEALRLAWLAHEASDRGGHALLAAAALRRVSEVASAADARRAARDDALSLLARLARQAGPFRRSFLARPDCRYVAGQDEVPGEPPAAFSPVAPSGNTSAALLRTGWAHLQDARTGEAIVCFHEAKDRARSENHAAAESDALAGLCTAAEDRGELEDGVRDGCEAAELAGEAGLPGRSIPALVAAAGCLAELGRFARAWGVLEEALFLAEGLADRAVLATALCAKGRLLVRLGASGEAERLARFASQLSEDAADRRPHADAASLLGLVHLACGAFDPAVSQLRGAIARAPGAVRPGREATLRATLAEALLGAGRPDEARAEADRALALAESAAQPVALVRASIACARAEAGEPLLHAERALELSREMQAPHLVAEALRLRGALASGEDPRRDRAEAQEIVSDLAARAGRFRGSFLAMPLARDLGAG